MGTPDLSPDHLVMTVDGHTFEVRYDASQPGVYHYTRLSAPAIGYGFTSWRFDHLRRSVADHEMAIRRSLASTDPVTGFIEDDDRGDPVGLADDHTVRCGDRRSE